MTDAEVDALVGRTFRTRYEGESGHVWVLVVGTEGDQLVVRSQSSDYEGYMERDVFAELYVPVYTTTADMIEETS